MHPTLKQLERLRLALQDAKLQAGYADHKFERWNRRDYKIANEAYETLMAQQAIAEQLEPQLVALVNQLRAEQPNIIEDWVAFHQTLIQNTIAALEQKPLDKHESAEDRRRDILGIRRFHAAWQAVRQRESDYFLYRSSYYNADFYTQPPLLIKEEN